MKLNAIELPALGRAGWVVNFGLAATLTLGTGLGYAAQSPEIQGAGGQTQAAPASSAMAPNMAMDDSALSHPDGATWANSGHGYSNDRFSTLKQVNASNVAKLTPVAIAQTGYTASFETTPLVINGVMYITTPMVNSKQAVIALDATTGAHIWQYDYTDGLNQICCGPVNRGAVAAYGKLYFLTLDNHLIALDPKTGQPAWSVQVADAQAGYSETMAPQAYDGNILIGSAGGEWPIRGYVASYDAQTGKQNWRWDSTDPNTYAGDSWKVGGATAWTTPALDTKLGLLIFSTGNPNPDLDGASRLGDNLYSDSIVALDVKTGKLAWYYQEVKHDVWDYDAVSNVVLFDTMVNGKRVPAAGEAGKTAFFYIVDRRTGKLIRRSEAFDKQQNMFTQPTPAGVQMLPGANGGDEWSPPAYSPLTHYIYIMGMNQLMTFSTAPNSPMIPGQIRLGSSFKNVTGDTALQNGTFTAINVDTGKIVWNDTLPQPLMGGALVTAGNVAFIGEGNGWFDAFNATNGKLLWRYNLGAGVNAPPVAYSVNGREYIAVAAGGNFQMSFPYGDALAIFALPRS